MDYLKIKNAALLFFPVFLFLLNFISKFLYLTSQDIGLDEPFTIYHAQFGFSTIIDQLKNYNNPPLYELILHGWIKLFGISPLSVRMLPLIFASLSPVALFYFGKKFFSEQIAVVSSLLLSLSYLPVYYAHDCRVYSLFLLLGILSMFFFLESIHERIYTKRSAFLFILFSSLLIYAHYFGILILFFQFLFLLFFYRNKLVKFSIYYLIILIVYLPHLFPLLIRMNDSVSKGTWLAPPSGIESLYNMLWSFNNYPSITVFSIIVLISSAIKAMIKKDVLPDKKETILILIWFLFPYLGMFFISYWVPMYISRYLIFAFPAYYILLTICIEYLFKSELFRKIVFFGLIISFAFTTKSDPDKKQYVGEAVNLINRTKDPETLVIVSPPDYLTTFAYHYNRKYFSEISDNKEYHLLDSLMKTDNIYFMREALELDYVKMKNFKKIIYYGEGEKWNDPDTLILNCLYSKFTPYYKKAISNSHTVSFFLTKKN